MINIKGVTLTLQDIIFIGGIIIAGIKWYSERNKLPAKYQRILDTITFERVEEIINKMDTFKEMNKEQKLILASDGVVKLAELAGIKIPRTVAILLVQYVYAKTRDKDSKIRMIE
jgi:hypothetical protein